MKKPDALHRASVLSRLALIYKALIYKALIYKEKAFLPDGF